MRLVAQIESVGAMAPQIRHGKRPDRDREGLEGCGLAGTRRFACDHSSDVGFKGYARDRVAAIRRKHADTYDRR